MYIDRVKRVVQIILNTDNRGNFTPSDFNDILKNVIDEIYEDYLYQVNQMVNRENRGLINGELENIPDRIREKLMHYLDDSTVAISSGTFDIPEDLRYFDTVVTADGYDVEMCRNRKEFNTIKGLSHTTPSVYYPLGIKKGTAIEVLPDTVDEVTFYYLRNPLTPKWTYTIVGDVELFNPSANDFQDIDMHISEEENIIRKVCLKFGINLKEGDIQNAMAQYEVNEQQTENAS